MKKINFHVNPDMTLDYLNPPDYSKQQLAKIIFTFHGVYARFFPDGELILNFYEMKKHHELKQFLISKSCGFCKKLNHQLKECPEFFCPKCKTQAHKKSECEFYRKK
jgi:hypothetical protein